MRPITCSNTDYAASLAKIFIPYFASLDRKMEDWRIMAVPRCGQLEDLIPPALVPRLLSALAIDKTYPTPGVWVSIMGTVKGELPVNFPPLKEITPSISV
jgi:hypothetical protein